MGRISDPVCQKLAEDWSERILSALDDLGSWTWPPFMVKRGFLSKPQMVTPYSLEGPVQMGGQVYWAIAHIRRPSTFNMAGVLSPGEREFWLVRLKPGSPPNISIEGDQVVSMELGTETDLRTALDKAVLAGPKREEFYGNKGPLRHR